MAVTLTLDSACPASPAGLVLPVGFKPPPGLEPPPGLHLPFDAPPGLGFDGVKKSWTAGEDNSTESDGEGTSTASFLSNGSSEHDETETSETEDTEASQQTTLSADAPCFVPGLLVTDSPCFSPGPLPQGSSMQRTPLRMGAGSFMPGAMPGVPFMPMVQVEQSWQHWYEQGLEQIAKSRLALALTQEQIAKSRLALTQEQIAKSRLALAQEQAGGKKSKHKSAAARSGY